MSESKFSRSFFFKTQPPEGEPCALKWHYGGIMREIVGYYDSQASKRADRFVYATYETARAHCKKFNKMDFSESAFWKALRELRKRWIISEQVEREVWVPSGKKGHKVLRKLKGCIVAPHDCIAHMVGSECVFVGPFRHCGRWQRTGDAGPGSVLYWNGCAQHAPALPQPCPAEAQSAVPGTVPVQNQVQTAYSARTVASTVASTVSDSGQTIEPLAINPKNGGQAVVTVIPGVTEQPFKPEEPNKPAPPVKAAAQEKAGGEEALSGLGVSTPYGHDITKPAGGEITIGQRFANLEDVQLLEEISDGEYNAYAYKDAIASLAEYSRMVVEKNASQPWDNQRATCARLMDSVAKQMKRAKQEYSPGWLAVLRELRDKVGQCRTKYIPPRPAHWASGYQTHDGPPNESDAKLTGASNWKLCRDWIARDEAGRAAAGYTVKAPDGIWDKG